MIKKKNGRALRVLIGVVLLTGSCGCGADDEGEPHVDLAHVSNNLLPLASDDCGPARVL